jgi:hypothetical protein
MSDWEPQTDAELFDLLHRRLGVGDFDESGQVPWFRYRMTEIAKLKSMRTRRSISLADFALTARYCFWHHIKIEATWQLCEHVAAAKQEARANVVTELATQVWEALAVERTSPGPDSSTWIERLLLARGPFRRDVLNKWNEARLGKHKGVQTPVSNQGDQHD